MKEWRKITLIMTATLLILSMGSCNQQPATTEENKAVDSIAPVAETAEEEAAGFPEDSTDTQEPETVSVKAKKALPVIEIYNFHLTNRCPSCNAIENATTKTLERYFAEEVRQGMIKRRVVNVDEKANQKLAEKYQAFGAACFVTRIIAGKESTTDLTGPGFKFARNREEQFIEMMKNTIEEYLKH
jgi:hypothetical protein